MSKPAKPESQVPSTGRGTADSRHLLEKKPPRRTLDDMRKLSEKIKRARALKR